MALHLFLLWHNGMGYFPFVKQKLESVFSIKYTVNLFWDKKPTLEKLQLLYEFTLEESLMKIEECGYGEVCVFIIEDALNIPKKYLTKYGVIPVNKYAQEIKQQIRNSFNNQNLIHGTMTDFEFENDILVCLGCTKDTFWNNIQKE